MNFLSQYMSRFGPNMADEGGFMRQLPGFQAHAGGPGQMQSYDGSGINPQTGGGLQPMGMPTMHPNMGLPPMTANTGGGLPAMAQQAHTGGGLPAMLAPPQIGGFDPMQAHMGGVMPPGLAGLFGSSASDRGLINGRQIPIGDNLRFSAGRAMRGMPERGDRAY